MASFGIQHKKISGTATDIVLGAVSGAKKMGIALIKASQIRKVLSMKETVCLIDRVFKDHGNGKVVMPAKINLNMGEKGEWPHYYGSSNSMPAYIDSIKAMGVKFASGYAKNPERGLPFIHAVIILTEPETGRPLAVLDGTGITALRTGAASAIAVKYLARKKSSCLVGIIGAGLQGRMHVRALREVLDIKEIKIADLNGKAADVCAKEMAEECGLAVRAVSTNELAARDSDVLVTATVADEALVRKEWLKQGVLVVSVGSYQELDERIPLECDKLVVDNWEQNTHRGELVKLLRAGKIAEKSLYSELGPIAAGRLPGRERDDELICACLIGMGSLDIAAAKFVYEKLKERGELTDFDLLD